jgi:alpha/beta superfamily hydrolase
MKQERITFPSGELSLEGVCHLPEGEGPFPGVIVCHPHPSYGGNMDSFVVIAVCQALNDAGIAGLRFNVPGVGRSEGSLAGPGTPDDVSAALSCIAGREEVDAASLGVCGYSAGGIAAFSGNAVDRRVGAVAAISPPLAMAQLDGLGGYAGPKLVVSGEMDNFTSPRDVERFVETLSGSKECYVIPGVDHFWWGYESELGKIVASFFVKALRESRQA